MEVIKLIGFKTCTTKYYGIFVSGRKWDSKVLHYIVLSSNILYERTKVRKE